VIVLDTNGLSALMRQEPDRAVVGWLDLQARTSVWTTSVTVLEIRYGLQLLPAGKRRSLLVASFEAVLEDKIAGRIAGFDAAAARIAAELLAARRKRGRPGDLRDTMIAGIVLAHHATLATRNTDHFDDPGLKVVNPWSA
jgi:predicted nucleic acid-binding protein